MTDAQQELSRKVVNLPWSKVLKIPWDEKLRGMSFVVDAPGREDHMCLSFVSDGSPPVLEGIPDLCDPATVGVLAGLACELTGKPELSLERDNERWIVVDGNYLYTVGEVLPNGPTRGEAWANLLLESFNVQP
jgi:hypothetical protein